jgi:hypothetical protein
MSLLINDDLIWISVPRCASLSIERTLINSELDIKYYYGYRYLHHIESQHHHYKKYYLFNQFGVKETICVNRDWIDRWLSALEHLWVTLNKFKLTPLIEWEEIDNEFIINTFNSEFGKVLTHTNEWDDNLLKLLKNSKNIINDESHNLSSYLCILLSQNHWKENQPCTYEFNIKEIYKFEKFIQKRYGVSFNLEHLNSMPKIKNKIEINDELKTHLWNVFEKPFEKRNLLI